MCQPHGDQARYRFGGRASPSATGSAQRVRANCVPPPWTERSDAVPRFTMIQIQDPGVLRFRPGSLGLRTPRAVEMPTAEDTIETRSAYVGRRGHSQSAQAPLSISVDAGPHSPSQSRRVMPNALRPPRLGHSSDSRKTPAFRCTTGCKFSATAAFSQRDCSSIVRIRFLACGTMLLS